MQARNNRNQSQINYEEYMSRFYAYRKKCIVHELVWVGIIALFSISIATLIIYLFGHF